MIQKSGGEGVVAKIASKIDTVIVFHFNQYTKIAADRRILLYCCGQPITILPEFLTPAYFSDLQTKEAEGFPLPGPTVGIVWL